MKPTPGPWKFLKDQGFIHAESTDQVVCQLWNKYEEDFHKAKVNGKVLAASPDLLRTSKAVLEMLWKAGSPLYCSSSVAELRAAIHAADGTKLP